MTVTRNYKIAFFALDALYELTHDDFLGGLLGGMQLDLSDGAPMDPGALADWDDAVRGKADAPILDQILAYLRFVGSRYPEMPPELANLIQAIAKEGTPERVVVQSAVSLETSKASNSESP